VLVVVGFLHFSQVKQARQGQPCLLVVDFNLFALVPIERATSFGNPIVENCGAKMKFPLNTTGNFYSTTPWADIKFKM